MKLQLKLRTASGVARARRPFGSSGFLCTAASHSRRCAFTLIQLLIVVGIVMLLGAVLLSAFSRSSAAARRAQCDARLKSIALALNAYQQEHGFYPAKLSELVANKYYKEALRCPADPRPDGSYEEFYVIRAARGSDGLPILVCPFHEQQGNHGAQAFAGSGSYTKQFSTQPAVLAQANNATLLRPGKSPIAAAPGIQLYGGDRIKTASGGKAVIRFADGSVASVEGGTDVTVLQSFVAGQTDAPLYSLVRQQLGEVTYEVNHGSRFDVVTPTATAGALGTKFTITVDGSGNASLQVLQGQVYLSTLTKTALAPLGAVLSILPTLPGLSVLPHLPGLGL